MYLLGYIYLLLAIFCQLPAHAQQLNIQALRQQDIRMEQWNTGNGLPQNTINDMVIHRGYLWCTTFDGLVRFDGQNFTIYRSSRYPQLPDNRLLGLYADPAGTLWIASEHGHIISMDSLGRFRVIRMPDKLQHSDPVIDMLKDHKGRLWYLTRLGEMGYYLNGHLHRLRIPQVQSFGTGKLSVAGRYVWAVWGMEALLMEEGRVQHKFTSDKAVTAIIYKDGQPWMLTDGGKASRQLQVGRVTGLSNGLTETLHGLWHPAIWDQRKELYADKELGSVYQMATMHALAVTRNDRMLHIYAQDNKPQESLVLDEKSLGLKGLLLKKMLPDGQGGIFLATNTHGLLRIQPNKIKVFGLADGLEQEVVLGISAWKDHLYWATNCGPVYHLYQNKLEKTAVGGCSWAVLAMGPDSLLVGQWGSGLQLYRHSTRQMVQVKEVQADIVLALLNTEKGLFVGSNKGVWHQDKKGQWHHYLSQLVHPDVRQLYLDRSGQLWVGTMAGLSVWNGKTWRHYSPRQLGGGHIRALWQDPQGAMWVGTYDAGLIRIMHNKISRISKSEGLWDEGVFTLLPDARGRVWMSCNRGIYAAQLSDLHRVADGRLTNLSCISFGARDGLQNQECNGGFMPAGLLQGEQLVLPTAAGLAIAHLDSWEPAVLAKPRLLDVLLDGKSSGNMISIPAGTIRVDFIFDATEFAQPERLRFWCRLEGYEQQWIDLQGRRSISYTNLRPGTYTLQLRTVNADGKSQTATYRFEVEAHFFQSVWFWLLLGLAVMLAVVILARWRLSGVQRKALELEEAVKLRTRELDRAMEVVEHRNRELSTVQQETVQRNRELELVKGKLEEQHLKLQDSMAYALRIQQTLLADLSVLDSYCHEHGALYLPRDVVSGDFYWTEEQEGCLLLAVADCTGHGVPGALMSMLGITFLNQLVQRHGLQDPAELLEQLDRQLRKALRQSKGSQNRDGMDIALCLIEPERNSITFSGANRNLYLLRKGRLQTIPGTRRFIGGQNLGKKNLNFANQTLRYEQGDLLYLATDGYADQFGGEYGRKFMTENFLGLLEDIHELPMEDQILQLHLRLSQWQGAYPQLDDILVLGLRF